jgi:hypothetical protein
MFEITGDDIAALNDEDLRALVGRLCEAELCSRDLSTAAVTWSGNQTAKDGGLDVRVALPAGTDIDGFIPKADAGFQVKKQDMPRGEVLAEMKPQPTGEIRPVIAELAKASGAYIIVSGAGSTADSALRSRRDAMAEAVKGMPDAEKLTLDFYDRGRMATWVRSHAGLIPWVRSKIGKSIPGWRAYGSWSYRPEGVDAAYLVDAAARIRTGDKDEGDGISATDGINKIRDGRELRLPLSTSTYSATSFQRPPLRYRATASRCASNPRPLRPCLSVETRRYDANLPSAIAACPLCYNLIGRGRGVWESLGFRFA